MNIKEKIHLNVKKPNKSIYGWIQLKSMNRRHNKLALWGMSFLNLENKKFILDIGCGGGQNVSNMLKIAKKANVYGIDYSQSSVDMSIKKNNKDILNGFCRIVCGEVQDLPYENETFDQITAFETIYFWNDLNQAFKEVYRVLQKGGSFVVCNEAQNADGLEELIKKLDFKVFTAKEIEDAMKFAGFTKIKVNKHDNGKWILVEGIK